MILSQKSLTTAACDNGGHDNQTPATKRNGRKEPVKIAIMDALVREVKCAT
jgi:hypothetical protein